MTSPLRFEQAQIRALARDWRRSLNSLHAHVISPAPRIVVGVNTWLRPDFYLPGARQYLVVLPDMNVGMIDEQLMACAASNVPPRQWTDAAGHVPDYPVIGLGPDGLVMGWERGKIGGWPAIALYRCTECLQWWFLDDSQSWRCQCCGYYDGNAGILDSVDTPLSPFPALPRAEVD